jgi:hypothetical protein
MSQILLACIAILFGIVTIIAGSRVLAGADPGYSVFRPLLIYNTVMGMAYIAAGVLAWRNLELSKYAAALIFILNALVLGIIGYLYATGGDVALESLRAMILRTFIWFVLFFGLALLAQKQRYSPGG